MTTRLPATGDKIQVLWGKFGYLEAVVTSVSKEGTVYAKRWNRRRAMWTTPRRLYPYRGRYSTDLLYEGVA